MTTSTVDVTAGSGTHVATNDISEDAVTKKLQRIVLNTSAGAELDLTTSLTAISTAAGAPADAAWASGNGSEIAILKAIATQALSTAATAIKGAGTAGSADANVVTVQGIASGTALPVSIATAPVLVAGSALIGKVGIDQTTPGTTDSVSVKSVGFDVQTSITRAANTTAYTAGDVVGGAIDLGVLGPSAKPVMITSVQLEADIAAIPSGQTTWSLYLYSVTPPSAIADNGAGDIPSGDRASFLGVIPLATMVDLGSTCYMEANGINKQVLLAGTHLFGYLVTVAAFTPAGNSEVYKLTVHTVAV